MDTGIGSSSENIFQLKITLKGTRPPIWRRLLISGDSTFLDLHLAIQACMGWRTIHLHMFELKIGGIFKNCITIGKPNDLCNDFSHYQTDDVLDESKVRLCQYLNNPKDRLIYEYDFGDEWIHLVVLEKILKSKPELTYPICLKGKLACPPEDCGGVDGYKELLEIIKNPNHREYEETISWLKRFYEGNFDPIKFDPKAVVFTRPF